MKHMIITGASRRLGLFLTQKYLHAGWAVTALTRQCSKELQQLACKNLTIITLDYQNDVQVRDFCTAMRAQSIDLLIHNASLFTQDPEDPAKIADMTQQLNEIHLQLPALLNSMLFDFPNQPNQANIVHMTDIYAENPKPNFSLYCASKAAAQNLALSFAKKLAPNVRVNSIQPGALKFLPEHSEQEKNKVLEGSLLKIEAGFEPIYQAIQFLVNNPFMTGSVIKVDGGRSICR